MKILFAVALLTVVSCESPNPSKRSYNHLYYPTPTTAYSGNQITAHSLSTPVYSVPLRTYSDSSTVYSVPRSSSFVSPVVYQTPVVHYPSSLYPAALGTYVTPSRAYSAPVTTYYSSPSVYPVLGTAHHPSSYTYSVQHSPVQKEYHTVENPHHGTWLRGHPW